jgi:hypothetical protein
VTLIQTTSGRALDLIYPTRDMIDFDVDVPEQLAKAPRFGGAIPGDPYSVAQHCVEGCDAIMRAAGDRELAGVFLLHDAHEFAIGDITTPVAHALTLRIPEGRRWVSAKPAVDDLKMRLDAAIFAAAGVDWPLAADVKLAVKAWDLRMLAAERRDLCGPMRAGEPDCYSSLEGVKPADTGRRIAAWHWRHAALMWRNRFGHFFPGRLTHRKEA